MQADCITTPFDIEQKALNVTCGRASGPDQIPPELVMCNPKAIARLLAPLGLKTTGRVCEPYQWSGGKYKELYKRSGVQCLVESFRAILLSDIFGKMLQGPLRTKTVNFATDFFGDYQFAGLPGKGCDLAHHALLAFMDYAAFLQVSSINIFVDCHNAFYSMVRSLVLEYGDNDQILAYVIQRMGRPQDLASEILEACHRPPAARLAMLPPHLQAVLQQHYSASWFFVEGASNPARTTTGSKPGIPAADICFMLIFARVTNEIRETFCTLGLAEKVSWSGNRFPTKFEVGNHGKSCTVCDVSFADDLVLMALCRDNNAVIAKATLMFEITFCKFAVYGLPLNLKRGKCAVMISARGKGSDKVQFQMYNQMDFQLPVLLPKGPSKVHLVLEYKHLGNWVQSNRACYQEYKYRNAIATSSAKTLENKAFKYPGVLTVTKTNLAVSVPFSQLYYNHHVMSDCNPTITKGFHASHMRIARTVAGGYKGEPSKVLPDAMVLAQAELPDAALAQRIARLRYFPRLYRYGADFLLCLLEVAAQHKQGWFHLVYPDLLWLHSQCPQVPHPEDSGALVDFATASIDRWKRVVKFAQNSTIQYRRLHAFAQELVPVSLRHQNLLPSSFGIVAPFAAKALTPTKRGPHTNRTFMVSALWLFGIPMILANV